MTNDEIIYQTCINNNIPAALANLIVAQAKHETGNYTSPVFMDCNNAFGYNATNGNNCPNHFIYASYNSLQDSTLELIQWIQRRQADGTFPNDLGTITTALQYATLLSNAGYFTDSIANYANGIESFLSSGNNLAYVIPLLLVLGLLVYKLS